MKNPLLTPAFRSCRLLGAAVCLLLLAGAAHAQEPEAPDPQLPERAGSFLYTDKRLTPKPPRRAWELYLADARDPRGPERDPKFNVAYPHQLIVRVVDLTNENSPTKTRRFIVHFQKPNDEVLARKVGGVMARLYWAAQDYLGRAPASEYTSIWLAHDGEAGAEEFSTTVGARRSSNIYLHKVEEPRAPAEWVRELAHEWSHLTLPPAGPYTEPEQWGNGYLGERLYMKWLLYDNGQTDLWGEPINAKGYYDNQIVPLRQAYLNAGPGAKEASQRDKAGMDFFIGQMLTLEAAHGLDFMKRLFDRFATPNPGNLGLYYATVLRDMKIIRLPIEPDTYVPNRTELEPGKDGQAGIRAKKASYWIFMPGGEWQIDVQGTLPEKTTATVEKLQLKPARPSLPNALAWETTIIQSNGMWRRFDLAAPPGETLEIHHIRISRKDALTALAAGPAPVPEPAPAPEAPKPAIIRRR